MNRIGMQSLHAELTTDNLTHEELWERAHNNLWEELDNLDDKQFLERTYQEFCFNDGDFVDFAEHFMSHDEIDEFLATRTEIKQQEEAR